jgi:hypothetical protein
VNKITIYLVLIAFFLFLSIVNVMGYPNSVCYPLNKTTVCLGENATGFKINQSDILNSLGGVNYDNSTGIGLSGTTFSLLLGFRLPQTCTDGQFTYWNNTNKDWRCISSVSGGGTNTTYNITNNNTINFTYSSFQCSGSDKLLNVSFNSSGKIFGVCGTDLNTGGSTDTNNNVTSIVFTNGSTTTLTLVQDNRPNLIASFNNTDNDGWNLTYLYANLANMTSFIALDSRQSLDNTTMWNNIMTKVNLTQLVNYYTRTEVEALNNFSNVYNKSTTDSKYYLQSNPSSYISDGNTLWDNAYGFITSSVSNLSSYWTTTIIQGLGNLTNYKNISQSDTAYLNRSGTGSTMLGNLNMNTQNITGIDHVYVTELNVSGDVFMNRTYYNDAKTSYRYSNGTCIFDITPSMNVTIGC